MVISAVFFLLVIIAPVSCIRFLPKILDMASQAPRAPRPLTSHFVVQDLGKEFTQLAMHKCPGFDWDGSGYQASARSALGDAEALAKHMVPLTILLKLCSTGFPSHPNLLQALTTLHSIHKGTAKIVEAIVAKLHQLSPPGKKATKAAQALSQL